MRGLIGPVLGGGGASETHGDGTQPRGWTGRHEHGGATPAVIPSAPALQPRHKGASPADHSRHQRAGHAASETPEPPQRQSGATPDYAWASRARGSTSEYFTAENARALKESAKRIGARPLDFATAMAYEKGGSFSPNKWGGKGGRYLGLIQFGPAERRQYGAHPGQTFPDQLGAAERFLKDRGYKPGMGLRDLYSTRDLLR